MPILFLFLVCGGRSGFLRLEGRHLLANLRGNIPYEFECRPGAEDEECGNKNAKNLEAEYRSSNLYVKVGIVADPIESKEAEAETNGLTDTAGKIECAVYRSLGTLARKILVVINSLTDKSPLHLNRNHSKARADAENNAVNKGIYVHKQV